MKPFDFKHVRNAVIVAPHPDDEAIGAYGLIRSLRSRGARVRVVMVTDGTGSHPGSTRWPAPRLARRRRRETLGVLRDIGVGKADVSFLGLPDGGISGCTSQRRTLRRAIRRARRSDLLLIPARDDDHPDHRTVAAIAERASSARRRFEYLVWPARNAPSRRASHYLRLGPVAAAKRGAIRRYRSQTGGITDDPSGFTISRSELAAFSRPVERYRELRR